MDARRQAMVTEQLLGRGLSDPALLAAFRRVPRELFVADELRERAYDDASLPIGAEELLPRPFLVARVLAALGAGPAHHVLVVGDGSGYTAALLAELAHDVVLVERHEDLADLARRRLRRLGVDNVVVVHGDATAARPRGAPWDRVAVLGVEPATPEELVRELAPGGALVVAVGGPRAQHLRRVTVEAGHPRVEDLGPVAFAPLLGEGGFGRVPIRDVASPLLDPALAVHLTTPELIAQVAEPLDDLETSSIDALVGRLAGARVVLLGESTHGTSEFYRLRARITQELVARHGFRFVAVEADWPDAARIDTYARHFERPAPGWQAFSRFPTWMWRNAEVLAFVEWLRAWNRDRAPDRRAAFHGLDLYSLNASMNAVVSYLDDVDPAAAHVARERYGCLTPWASDPTSYGRSALSGHAHCEEGVVAMLRDLLARRATYVHADGERFLDAAQNARLAANAERYYRVMWHGSRESWNLRDRHMFETLRELLDHHGPGARAVVWEHNTHVGDAGATEFATRGELNVGQLCKDHFGDDACRIVGFGTDHGTVAAATVWDGPMEIKDVVPSHGHSYEHLCHQAGLPAFVLSLRDPAIIRDRLLHPHLERAIGVIYRPETELQSHYFRAVLPRQFDEYVWIDETHAVTPLGAEQVQGQPETFPFGL